MEFSDAELSELRVRCLMASERGYTIARADDYLEALSAEAVADVPEGEEEGSAGHLCALATAALEAREGGVVFKKKGKKAEPKKPEPVKAEVKAPEPKVEETKVLVLPEEAPVSDPAPDSAPDSARYEDWTYDELYAEAQARDIPGRSQLKNKDALALALMEYDEAAAKAK